MFGVPTTVSVFEYLLASSLDTPKSANLKRLLCMSMLSAFRSRWMILSECSF